MSLSRFISYGISEDEIDEIEKVEKGQI